MSVREGQRVEVSTPSGERKLQVSRLGPTVKKRTEGAVMKEEEGDLGGGVMTTSTF